MSDEKEVKAEKEFTQIVNVELEDYLKTKGVSNTSEIILKVDEALQEGFSNVEAIVANSLPEPLPTRIVTDPRARKR